MENKEKEWQENNDTTSLVDTLLEYISYWKWFILSILICLVGGIAFILTSQKEYKSSISVILDEERGASRRGSSELNLDALGLLSTTNNLDNEIAIFSSPDLMEQVVDTLNLQSTYYIKTRFRKKEIYLDAPVYVKYIPYKKELSNSINISVEKSSSGYAINAKYKNQEGNEVDLDKTVENLPLDIALADSIGSIHFHLTGAEMKDSEKYYVLIQNKSYVTQNLLSKLSVSPTSKSSSVLNLNLLVNNTERGDAILRDLVRQYNDKNVKVNNEMAYNTALFINDRLKEIAIELGDVERDVVDYKQRNRIADLGSEAQLFVQQSGQNQERLMEVETQLNVVALVDKFVSDPSNNLKMIPNLGISDPALSQVITEYNSKLLDSDAILKSTGEENPARKRLTEEINNMRSSISSSINNVKQAYSISKRDIQRLSGTTQSRIQSIPQQEKGLLEKVRQQQIKESLFLFLMQKREETNISIASTSDKARIISSPQIDISPIAPKTKVILLAALLLGILIPVVVIYLINLFRVGIKSRTELERLSKVSVIGQIAKNVIKDQIVLDHEDNTPMAEMFRSLRNNLNFAFKSRGHQVILITSTISGEGKTFISINLAMSYALMGKKVLLVGADIRNPKFRRYLGMTETRGLTDYLIDSTNNWKSFVASSELNPNLDVMISGVIPPNPNELLMSPRLKVFLSQAKNDYDIVILDTAPVGLVSDTYLIDEYVDATLYVVRENVTPKAAINFINIQKSENKLINMYLVLNDATLDNNYKYGYGKGYGYGKANK